jgi:hypothetical protein
MTLAGLVIVAALLAAHIRWSFVAPGGGQFFAIYAGARGFLFQTDDPYSRESALSAQKMALGGIARADTDSYRLTLPFFLLPLAFPVALVPNPEVARGIAAFLAQLAVIATVLLGLRVVGSPVPRPFVVAFTVLVLFSVYVVIAILEGTPAVLLALAYIGILWSLQTDQDELAGALAVLCLCMWEAGLPFLILVTWRVFHESRWRILAGFGMTLVILLGFAFLVYPDWLMPFLTANIGMIRSASGTSTTAALLRLSPEYGLQISRGLTVFVLATLIYEWAVGRDSDLRRFVWIAFLALAATPFIGLRTDLGNLVVLIPAVVLISAAAMQRRRPGAWLGALLLTLLLALPWYLAWRWLAGGDLRSQDYLFLFLPAISLIGLYWTRWWFLRPTRTWLDEIRAAGG